MPAAARGPVVEQHPSRGARLFGRFLRRGWQWIVVAVLTLALGIAAYANPGLVETDVHLDEGTVYAVKRDQGLVGTVNTQIEELTAATSVGDSESSILQHEDLVLIHGQESSTLTQYTPSRNRLESPMTLPVGAEVQLVGSKLLINSPQNGRVWSGEATDVLAMDLQRDKAQLEVGLNGTATLTADGDLIGLDVGASQLLRQVDGEVVRTNLPFTLDAGRLGGAELSAVGDLAVVLDRASGRIWVEGMPQAFDVSGASSARLAPPSAEALGGAEGVRAVYATQAGLIGVTQDGPRSLSGQLAAAPVTPVQLGDCVYGAFGDQFVKRCPDAEPEIRTIPGYDGTATSTLSFQVNRRTVALNEALTGVVWLVDQDMARIDRWDDLVPETTDQPPPPDAPLTNTPPDRSQDNRPPVAQDDQLTARKGRATILQVLDNDSDPDGDILTISAPAEIDGASLQIVRGGAGLQITIPPETTAGTLTFSYEISDGEFRDSASVTVTVADPDAAKQNKAPYPFELAQPMSVRLGGKFTKRVLLDWRDPEGDPLILEAAALPPGAEDLVSFTPDGTITYQDVGKTPGVKKINLTVSDGQTESMGELLVNVVEDLVPPLANGDFATVPVGQTVVVRPLENDIGENLILTEVEAGDCSACNVVSNYNEGWFSFSATQAGTHYLTYNVQSGPVATGVVRIDVVETGTNNPPIAALDVALLPPGGSVFIDPLLNDTDVDGDVLVVQSFSADPSLKVVMERRHLMTISANSQPDAPVTVEYVVSDGRHTARGTIVVIPTRNTGSVQPKAVDDDIRVRAGSVATAHVLENDTSPIGLGLGLTRILENPLGQGAWVDGDTIRVEIPAGSQSQQIALPYEVTDTEGNVASATLAVTVVSEDAANEAPTPHDVVDRVLSGSLTRIPVRLDGIDPNGDAVRLVGLGSGPGLGRVTEVGEKYLTYEAFPSSQGTDTFHYEVVDAHGQVGRGQVKIGIAPPGNINEPPIGVHDDVRVRPGRPIQIAALANDYDIEGDGFAFAAGDPVSMDDDTLHAEIVNEREIKVDPISEPGVYTGTYRLQDLREQYGNGTFAITVDEEAPLLPPVARDDIVAVGEIIDKDFVEVDVRANDFDPDGSHERLRIELPEADADDERAARISEGGLLTVPVGARMQQVRYRLVDGDGESSFGLVTIPGTDDAVPLVRDPSRTLEATAGQPAHISFEDLLVGTDGRAVKLTSTDTIAATTGSAVPATGGVEFTPHVDYRGPAAVVFEVIDVVPEGDRTAKRAYVTIPVEVKAARSQSNQSGPQQVSNLAPEQVTQPRLLVGPDEGEFRLSLMPLFRDPEGHDIFFLDLADAGGDAPITWRSEANNSVVVAEAPITAKAGMTRRLRGEVRDAGGAARQFEVLLEMTSSRMPLTTTVTDVVDEAQSGRPVTVPVLANDTSHLNDKTLAVEGARILSGEGTVEVRDDVVTITPSEGFVGTLTASYTVMDATGDPARRQDGSIRVTVTDVPSAPSAPFGGEPGDAQIRFEYQPGSTNGHPIERRVVTATAPGRSPVQQDCPGTTCTVTGLRNNVPWTLSVVEFNKLGPSEPSPQSAPYTPDVKPLAPPQPQVTRGDQSLTVQWQPAPFENMNNQGSPVTQYTLVLYNADGAEVGRKALSGSTFSHTWTGLTNGSNYVFGVVATNNAGDSPESTRTSPMFPVGPPKGSVTVSAAPVKDSIGGSFSVEVNTAGLDPNGDPAMRVYVVPMTGSNVREDARRQVPYPAPAQSTVTFSNWGESAVRFRVVAENLHSSVAVGETPEAIVAWPTPSVQLLSAITTPEYAGGMLLKLNSPEVRNKEGAGLTYEYARAGGSSWRRLTPVGDYLGTAQDFTPGVPVNLSVRAVLTNSTDQRTSSVSNLPTMTPLSSRPLEQPLGELVTVAPDRVRIGINPNPGSAASGGWTSGHYYVHTGDYKDQSSASLPAGETTTVHQGWTGTVPGTNESWRHSTLYSKDVTVPQVSRFEKSGDNFIVTVRYAYGSSACNVYDHWGGGRELLKELRPNAEGTIHMDEAFPIDPAAEVVLYRELVYVECSINNNTAEWSRTIPG
ncbi:Ig-like domain-containing protein [Tessaracoccus oleiagri]|uniref:Fibronectin type III domain-containing protein n=1 Tax=Tessaracoccus oleiagri TaxID=686624 RepID=A0A1G9I9K8_9ACTN|nr:Ig-like domain-containing protein [Tessaracoccus oleiagri]SDL21524.1 Fibronectin type III domain-containing protein [Tessaracoccus oleiagri]